MKYKYILLEISLIIFILFSVSCVVAADIGDTIAINENEIQVNDNIVSNSQDGLLDSANDENMMSGSSNGDGDNEDLLGSSGGENLTSSSSDGDDNEDLLGSSGGENLTSSSSDGDDNGGLLGSKKDGTFTALQRIINNAAPGDTITLDRNYFYNSAFSKDGIVINKSLTIDGKGHTLNGQSKSRIFKMDASLFYDNVVTIKNIKFINGYTKGYGGAILSFVDLTVKNCVFTNNRAVCCGGAINSLGHLNCIDSTFNKNYAVGDAGAVFTLSLLNPKEYIMQLVMRGILSRDDIVTILMSLSEKNIEFDTDYITKCVFKNNVAKGRGGGAVYAFGHIKINSCRFDFNKAGQHGGAVFGNKNLYIKNSKFNSNYAPKYGGAVYFKCHEQGGSYVKGKWVPKIVYYSCMIQDSTFTKNIASKGGAIYGFKYYNSDKKHEVKVVRCNFASNKASLSGRDIVGGSYSRSVFNYPVLTLNSVDVKKSSGPFFLTVTVKKLSVPLKGKTVIFKFNGITFKAKTNSKGVAKVTIGRSLINQLTVGQTVAYQAYYCKETVKKTATVMD